MVSSDSVFVFKSVIFVVVSVEICVVFRVVICVLLRVWNWLLFKVCMVVVDSVVV